MSTLPANHNTNALASDLSARLVEAATLFFQDRILDESQRYLLALDASARLLHTLLEQSEDRLDEQKIESAIALTTDSDEAAPAQPNCAEGVSQGCEEEQLEDAAICVAQAESHPDPARLAAYDEAARAVTRDSAAVTVTASKTGKGIHTRWSYPEGELPSASTQTSSSDSGSGPSRAQLLQDRISNIEARSPPPTPRRDTSSLAGVTLRSGKRARKRDSDAEHPDSPPTSRRRLSEPESSNHPSAFAVIPTTLEASEGPSNQNTTPVHNPLRREYAFYIPPIDYGGPSRAVQQNHETLLVCPTCRSSAPPLSRRRPRDKDSKRRKGRNSQ